MLELESDPADDPAFLEVAGRLIAGAATASGLGVVVAVHIDHWFGERWLGFCGKLLGAAGVRNRRLDETLTPPPFHPHRVLSARAYCLTEPRTFEYRDDVTWLHSPRTSQENLGRSLLRDRLYAWYSGDTATTDRGVVMVYVVTKTENAAWYVSFHKTPMWHLAQTVGVSPHAVHELLTRGGNPATPIESC